MVAKFGEKVRSMREELGLSQTQLGDKVHMTQRKVSYIECGKYEPSIEDIIELCTFFDVSSDYLIGLSNESRQHHR